MRHLTLHLGRVFLFLFWVVFLLLGSAMVWLTATEQGTRWALEKAVARSPYPLELSGIHGTLVDKIGFEQLNFEKDQLRIEARNGLVDWQLKHLLKRELWLDTVQAESLTLHLPPAKEKQPRQDPISLPEIRLPGRLSLQNLQLGKLTLIPQKGDTAQAPVELRGISARLAFAGSRLTLETLTLSSRGYTLHGKGKLDFSQQQPVALALRLTPETQAADTQTDNQLEARLDGFLKDYQLHAAGNLKLDKVPPYQLELDGKGNLNSLMLEQLTLQILDGEIHASGPLQWAPGLQATLALRASDLNPAIINEQYRGNINLSADLNATPTLIEGTLQSHGELRAYPLALDAHFSIDQLDREQGKAPRITLKDSKASLGENTLTLLGRFTARRAELLKFQLDAPELTRLHPQLQGKLSGSGNLRGLWDAPDIRLEMQADSIRWQDASLGSGKLEILPDLWGYAEAQHHIELTLHNLKKGKTTLESAHLDGTASPLAQKGTLRLSAPKALTLETRFGGALNSKTSTWRGSITELSLDAERLPHYQLRAPANILLSQSRQSLSPLCLQSPDKNIAETACLSLQHTLNKQKKTTDLQAIADISGLPIKRFSPWWPAARHVKSLLNHHTEISGDARQWQLSSRTVMDANNTASAEITLDPQSRSLRGDILANFQHLEWIQLMTDKVAQPKGSIEADIKLGGTLDAPTTAGHIKLREGSVKLPVTGTGISDGQLTLTLEHGQEARLAGNLNMDKRPITLSGSAQWKELAKWQATLSLKGDRIRVMNTKEARVYASPDLRLQASAKAIHLSGNIRIPRADITPGDIPPDAVTPSEDEYIISKNKEKAPERGIPISMDVTVNVGDTATGYSRKDAHKHRVRFDGFGLKTDLKGSLHITQQARKKPLGDGVLKIVNGKYVAYGQDLQIRRGEIYFNGPLSNPGLNIEAVRDTGEVVAGIRLRGTVNELDSSLFSVPTLSDTDILSYLLTGQSFQDQGGDGDNRALLLSAATRFGLKSSGSLIQRLKGDTGLDTLQIQAGSDITQSALLIGKYLTPDLYVQYALKLFEENDIISLRYQINKHLQLEATSGTSQGIDLIYQIER